MGDLTCDLAHYRQRVVTLSRELCDVQVEARRLREENEGLRAQVAAWREAHEAMRAAVLRWLEAAP